MVHRLESVFIKTQTQTTYSQSKEKLSLTSVSPHMNTLNTDTCDTEIEKEEKKKPYNTEMRRRQSLYPPPSVPLPELYHSNRHR